MTELKLEPTFSDSQIQCSFHLKEPFIYAPRPSTLQPSLEFLQGHSHCLGKEPKLGPRVPLSTFLASHVLCVFPWHYLVLAPVGACNEISK